MCGFLIPVILRHKGDFDCKGVIYYRSFKAGVNMWRNPARVPSSGVKVWWGKMAQSSWRSGSDLLLHVFRSLQSVIKSNIRRISMGQTERYSSRSEKKQKKAKGYFHLSNRNVAFTKKYNYFTSRNNSARRDKQLQHFPELNSTAVFSTVLLHNS